MDYPDSGYVRRRSRSGRIATPEVVNVFKEKIKVIKIRRCVARRSQSGKVRDDDRAALLKVAF